MKNSLLWKHIRIYCEIVSAESYHSHALFNKNHSPNVERHNKTLIWSRPSVPVNLNTSSPEPPNIVSLFALVPSSTIINEPLVTAEPSIEVVALPVEVVIVNEGLLSL